MFIQGSEGTDQYSRRVDPVLGYTKYANIPITHMCGVLTEDCRYVSMSSSFRSKFNTEWPRKEQWSSCAPISACAVAACT